MIKKKKMRKVILIFLVLLVVLTSSKITTKKKVLIIGDSISVGYTPFVQKDLLHLLDVSHNPGNAQDSGNGLEKIKEWIGEEKWDIIQFNWGLWDLYYRGTKCNRDKVNGTLTNTLEAYEKNLEAIVKIIKQKSDAKLIFVTTTYVPKEEEDRFTKYVQRYNKVAKKIMKKYGIEINDIYKKSKKIHAKFGIGNNDVHYKEEGYKELAKLIIPHLVDKL